MLKEFEWFEWFEWFERFEWFGPSPIEPFNSARDPRKRAQERRARGAGGGLEVVVDAVHEEHGDALLLAQR